MSSVQLNSNSIIKFSRIKVPSHKFISAHQFALRTPAMGQRITCGVWDICTYKTSYDLDSPRDKNDHYVLRFWRIMSFHQNMMMDILALNQYLNINIPHIHSLSQWSPCKFSIISPIIFSTTDWFHTIRNAESFSIFIVMNNSNKSRLPTEWCNMLVRRNTTPKML